MWRRLDQFQKHLPGDQGGIRFDLGLGKVFSEWRTLFTLKDLKPDLMAGFSVAVINLPMALAIALASGIEPSIGLTTAVIGSLICPLFGGTPLSVSGPALAMAVLIADVVQDRGLLDLLIVGLLCGVFQVATGFFRLGRFIRFVPLPVLAGFTAGIGAIIIIEQIPGMFGLRPLTQAHLGFLISQFSQYFSQLQWSSFYLGSTAILISFILPFFYPKLPASFFALLVPSALAVALGIDTQFIGDMGRYFPSFHMPVWHYGHDARILWTAFIVFALASMESILSSSSVAKLAGDTVFDPDQELIGQGIGNITSSLFGGIPITAVFERSARNVQAGAKTRRSVIFDGIFLLIIVGLFGPFLKYVSSAALTGVLLSIAFRMIHPREFVQIWQASRFEAFIYLVTFLVTLFVDLILGVQAGVVAALIISLVRATNTGTNIYDIQGNGPIIVSLGGEWSFLTSAKIESIRRKFHSENSERGIIFDFMNLESLDVSSGRQLIDLFEQAEKQNIKFAVKGISERIQRFLSTLAPKREWVNHIVLNETEVSKLLGEERSFSGIDKLVYGVERFRREIKTSYSSIFRNLAVNQKPHTLFITCSDSRINPNLITSTDPGELFIIRNVGNIVPQFGNDGTPAEGAAIEFAVVVLGVREIVVCGHSECGAIKYFMNDNLLSPEMKAKTPSLSKWLTQVTQLRSRIPQNATVQHAIEMNALLQVEHLKTYPAVAEKLETGELRVHAWFYDIGRADLEEWDPEVKMFVKVGDSKLSLDRRIGAGVQIQVPIEVKGE